MAVPAELRRPRDIEQRRRAQAGAKWLLLLAERTRLSICPRQARIMTARAGTNFFAGQNRIEEQRAAEFVFGMRIGVVFRVGDCRRPAVFLAQTVQPSITSREDRSADGEQ